MLQFFLAITIRINDDDEPEPDESFFVEVTDVRGGAVVGQGRVEVVILANDNVAGIISFHNQTRLIKLFYICSKH